MADGYSGWQSSEIINGVSVKRLRHFIPSRVTSLSRLHMEFSFGLRVLFSKWHKPEVVIVVSPALFSTAFVCLRARLGIRRPPTGIWIQDLYSRGLEETGMGNSRVAKVMKSVEGLIIRSATRAAVIHDRFAAYLTTSLHVPAQDVTVIRNWTHVKDIGPLDRTIVRRIHGWSDDDIIVLHAGNMGMKQGLENVVEAAKLAEASKSRVRFVLLGDGNQRSRLQEMSKGLSCLQFIAPVSNEDFMSTLRSADILLVNEIAGLREMSVPSKLTSYFLAGLPIVAATESSSTTASEIENSGAGIIVRPMHAEELVAAAEQLGSNPGRSAELGAAGIKFSEHHLSESVAIGSYDTWIREMVSHKMA